jgi:hypothetical protein
MRKMHGESNIKCISSFSVKRENVMQVQINYNKSMFVMLSKKCNELGRK